MIIGARAAQLVDVDFDTENCLATAKADITGETFDFDVQTRTKMSATKAKLTRFFDVVADQNFPMTSR
jgi:hypothetical protein